jgi:hypothetical protein
LAQALILRTQQVGRQQQQQLQQQLQQQDVRDSMSAMTILRGSSSNISIGAAGVTSGAAVT